MTPIIKICGMKYPDNIAEVSHLSPTHLGFIFHKSSPRYVEDLCGESISTLPEGITPVGVFVDRAPDEILSIADDVGITTVQLHGHESPADCRRLKEAGITVWKAVGVDSDTSFDTLVPYIGVADLFVFDTKSPHHGGTGRKYDWRVLGTYLHDTPFLLSGGISPEDVAAIKAFSHPRLAGIDLNSRFEVSPGRKDIRLLQSFLKEFKQI